MKNDPVFDFHTHSFPDSIARRAVDKLQRASHTAAFSDGTAAGLKESMVRNGITASLALPVATSCRQVEHINDSAVAMNEKASETGIYSLGCMHPDYPGYKTELRRLRAAGIRGIKLHPPYQDADIDDIRYVRILYEAACQDLFTVVHAGLDVGMPGAVHSLPKKIRNALKAAGGPRTVLAHMGGWRCWQEAADLFVGTGVYIDTSFSLGRMTPCGDGWYNDPEQLELMDRKLFMKLVYAFGTDRVLFGTDSPWGSQGEEYRKISGLPIKTDDKNRIFWSNAAGLIGLDIPT